MALLNTETDASRFCESPNLSNNEDYGEGSEDVGSPNSRCEDPNLYYDMSGDKILIIFNHYCYRKSRHYKIVPGVRGGTYQDVKRLEKTFRRRGFIVITHDDWTYKDITKYLSDVSKKDHSSTSCLAVAVMTHGMGSHVCAYDRLYPLADITDVLRTAPNLVGKPKLFFIQACREGHTSLRDEEIIIPQEADSLVLYSCYQDYLSYRTANGTWLMQALCQVIDGHHDSMDLVKMASLVNGQVAAKSAGGGNKQMPVTQLNLTKFLML